MEHRNLQGLDHEEHGGVSNPLQRLEGGLGIQVECVSLLLSLIVLIMIAQIWYQKLSQDDFSYSHSLPEAFCEKRF